MAVPNPERGTPGPHTDPGADRKREILDFVDGFTIETTPGSALKIPDYRDHLRPGATVSVTFLPGSDFADTVTTAKRLKDEGFKPAPHFAARSIPSRAAFEANLKRLQDEVGVEEVVALGGAVNTPVGAYESSMQLLDTGLFDKYGVKRIGLAGHPEGSPDISDKGLAEALTWKNAFAERSDAEFYLATQFCFEAAPIIAWDRAIRDAGNRLPIHIGIPGLATLKTLILSYSRSIDTEVTNQSIGIHHAKFGTLIKKKMDKLGIECAVYAVGKNLDDGPVLSTLDFIKKHFKMK